MSEQKLLKEIAEKKYNTQVEKSDIEKSIEVVNKYTSIPFNKELKGQINAFFLKK